MAACAADRRQEIEDWSDDLVVTDVFERIMKTKVSQIFHADLKNRFENKGLTLHGVPIYLSERHKYEKKEMDGGFLIFHFYETWAFPHTNARGRRRYFCHPEKRNELESEFRRN